MRCTGNVPAAASVVVGMKKKQLSKDSVLETLQALAAEHPGPAEPNERMDMFRGNGRPRCLIGHILALHGWKAKELIYDADGEPVRRAGIAGDESAATLLNIDTVTYALLCHLERANDAGESWKEIYERANRVF